MPVFVFTDTRRTPSVSACSSLYQSLIVSPGVAVTAPVGLKVRSTSLSLKTTLVRGSLLANGYMIAHGGTVAGAPPVQAPPLQVSLVVQALPSSQEGAGPPTHRPPLQASFVVHMLPSLQGAALLVCTQPVAWLQPSSVQGFPSSQLGVAPPTQFPPLQASLVVHALPSLQGAVLLVWTQPVDGLQVSSVQRLPSSQLGPAPPTHRPPLQASLVVQALPSVQGSVLLPWRQPVVGSQLSSVQRLLSLQLSAGPPAQLPWLQVSLVVQALPSVQGAVLFVCTQPVDGLQVSSVQTLPSSQLGGAPPTQRPPLQASLVVQALPSLQGRVLLACTQPVVALQLSSVQPLPSSQLGAGPPTHRPALQVSFSVHAFPSLQAALLLVWAQPVDGLQVSSVQSSQLRATPPMHCPPLQVSLVVQALPSLQATWLAVWTQPLAGSQLSSVQGLPSSHEIGV